MHRYIKNEKLGVLRIFQLEEAGGQSIKRNLSILKVKRIPKIRAFIGR